MELILKNLKKTYGNVKALKGINYTFTPGVYGILGSNGAGKSTMINLITDNVKRDKNGGEILFCDDNSDTAEDVDNLQKKYRVGNIRQRRNGLALRIVGDTLPEMADACSNDIDLEDVYLYYFGEGN